MANKRVYSMMVFAALFWSGAFITGKMATHQFPAFALTFFRFFFALPFIFIILYKQQPKAILPSRQQWLPLIVLGVIGTFAYHALFFSSLKYTTAINSSLIGATNPMVTTFLAIIFASEKINPLRVLGILLSFTGVFLVVTNGDLNAIEHFNFNHGDILMFLAVCCWATYSLLSRKFMQRYSITPIMATAYTFLICTIFAIPFVLWEKPMTYLPHTTLGGWGAIIYMAIFSSVLGYLFQLIAIQHIGASKAAVFINLVPVFTILQSVLILGEHLSWFKFFSALTIIIGVYITNRQPKEIRKEHPVCQE